MHPPQTSSKSSDLFLFPAETTARFVLLIIAVVCSSLFVFNTIYFSMTIHEQISMHDICYKPVDDALESGQDLRAMQDAFLSAQAGLDGCVASYKQRELLWMGLGLAGVLGVAGALYRLQARWIIRRRGLRPLTSQDHPAVVAELEAIAGTLGLRRMPQFFWSPASSSRGGQAFGRRKYPCVALNGGLVMLHRQDPAAFRAIVLHELAHLRNGDVTKTYFSFAVTWAFAIVAFVPYMVYLSRGLITGTDGTTLFLTMLARGLAIVAFIYATLRSLVRSREFYADARAASHDGAAERLVSVLAQDPALRSRKHLLPGLHPSADDRIAALKNQDRLLQLGFWAAFVTGVAAAIGMETLNNLLVIAKDAFIVDIPNYLILTLALAGLVVGVVGTSIWRLSHAGTANLIAHAKPTLWAFAVTSGLIVGQIMSFDSVNAQFDSDLWHPVAWLVKVVIGAIFFLGLWGIFRWMRTTAQLPGDGPAGKRTILVAYSINLAAGTLIMAVWGAATLISLFFVQSTDSVDMVIVAWVTVWSMIPEPVFICAINALWICPFVIRLFTKRSQEIVDTALKARLSRIFRHDAMIAVGMAVIGAAFYAGILIIFRKISHQIYDEEIRKSVAYGMAFLWWDIARVGHISLLMGVFTACWVKRDRFVYGLFASSLTQLLHVIMSCIIRITVGGKPFMLSIVWFDFGKMLSLGGMAALVGVSIAAPLAGRFPNIMRRVATFGAFFCFMWWSLLLSDNGTPDGVTSSENSIFVALAISGILAVILGIVTVVKTRKLAYLGALFSLVMFSTLAYLGISASIVSLETPSGVENVVSSVKLWGFTLLLNSIYAAPVALLAWGVRWGWVFLRRWRRRAARGGLLDAPALELAEEPVVGA